ncbi:class I SAM-dependent methyltransferase [Patescibacteria group bacterium]|nr:class I SAM-dependent methyltransferase [Patescibacteria group bacterium]
MHDAREQEYGRWWNENGLDVSWYRHALFEPRRAIHEAFVAWTEAHGPFSRVLEVGCGCAFFYPEVFSEAQYMGVDISAKEIGWSRGNDPRGHHTYLCGDITKMVGVDIEPEGFDLVFSHAVVDHVPDVDLFLQACVRASRGRVYLTSYRGWFPELATHRQCWSPAHTCFYNDLSPSRVEECLNLLGCQGITVAKADNGSLPETLITMRVP